MKIVTFLPEKWFRTIKPISLHRQIAYQNIPKDQKIISIKVYKYYILCTILNSVAYQIKLIVIASNFNI